MPSEFAVTACAPPAIVESPFGRDDMAPAARSSVTAGLVLSVFPGIDLLGKGFEAAGFCVVRGPDPIFGGDIRSFHPPPGKFLGVIGGPPCQDFSRARRALPTGYGCEMLSQFVRVVLEADPAWWLMENVPGVPTVEVPGYFAQKFNLNAAECGGRQRRLRVFFFGTRDGMPLVIDRSLLEGDLDPPVLATEGTKKHRRGWAKFCELQGISPIDLPGWSVKARYAAVGNAVPVYMAERIARSIARREFFRGDKVCICGCGRLVIGRHRMATVACRKRMQRQREKLRS